MSDPTPRQLLSRRDSTVDGLRGVAVMFVVLRHVLRSDVFGLHWYHSLSLGRMGVELFFVISGYVIGALLTTQRSDPRALARFMARRLVRLTPPYYAAIALAIALSQVFRRVYPAGHYLDLRPDLLLCSLSYVCYPLRLPLYLDVGWTLELEVQFYLLACALVPLVVALGAPAAWLAGACVLAAVPFSSGVTVLYYAPPFVVGMAIVALRRGAIGAPLFTVLALAISAYWAALIQDVPPGLVVALGALAIAFRVRMPRALVWVGGISYSLYLTHALLGPPFVRGVKLLGWPTLDPGWQFVWAGLAIAGCLFAAWLLHRFVEVPAVRWSHRIAVDAPIRTG